MPSFPSRPLSVAEISQREKIPGRTVRYAIDSGALRAQKLPGRTGAWLVYPKDLDAWLTKRLEATA